MVYRRRFALLAAVSGLLACSSDRAPKEHVQNESWAGTVCAPPAVLEGLDVSKYETSADFAQVKASGRSFVITRVSDGLGSIDAKFDTYYPAIKAAGMIRGSYQYFEPAEDPIMQADLVLQKIGGSLSPGDLPPAIDMEKMGTGISPAKITAAMKAWLDHIEAALGVKPIIYTGAPYWTSDMGNPSGFETYPLWIAAYPCNYSGITSHSFCPKIPDSWANWTFWQYSDGSEQSCATDKVTPPGVPGVPADNGGDRDFFPGTLADLMALAGGGGLGAGGTGMGTGGTGMGTGGSGAGGAVTGTYAAKYVTQSWPLSDAPAISMQVGQTMTGSIDMKNVGDVTWKAGVVELAPIPRDQPSDFQSASWVSPVRVSALTADVAPGAVGHFEWDLTPSKPGDFSPYFGLVADGIVWFADSGGPPDNDIQVHVVVSPGTGVGAGGQSAGAGGQGMGAGGQGVGAGGSPVGAGPLGMGGGKSQGTGGSVGASGASSSAGGNSQGTGPGGAGQANGGAPAGGSGTAATGGKNNGGTAGKQAINVVDESDDSGSSGGCSVASSTVDPRAILGLTLLGALVSRRRRSRVNA